MRRLRFFKILLPLALVAFVALLIWALNPPRGSHSTSRVEAPGSVAQGIRGTQLEGDRPRYEYIAQHVEEDDEGRVTLEKIDELTYFRDDGRPLVIRALSGNIEGESGQRRLQFDRQVVLHDPVEGLTLHLPNLEVDEAEGVARCTEEVRLEGPVEGSASRLVYGLQDQPTELYELVLRHDGATMSSRIAFLHDGLDDVELVFGVRLVRGEERLDTNRLRLRRGPDDELRSVAASGGVRGVWRPAAEGTPMELEASTVDIEWDAAGEPEYFELNGDALLRQEERSLAARTLRARRQRRSGAGWRLSAYGSVILERRFANLPAQLRAESVDAELDPNLALIAAEAEGRVRFDAPATRGEADRVVFAAAPVSEIRLYGSGKRKARLGRLRTRIAAEEIVTDAAGTRLVARRRVEATLLSGEPDLAQAAEMGGLFRAGEAVHFVSDRLEGEDGGSRLLFSSNVRGWQGDRSLAAERIAVDQATKSLSAREAVSIRLPRERQGSGVNESDYIQISGEELDFSGAENRAEVRGGVRIRVDEGWMESRRMEILLSPGDNAIEEIRCLEEVRLEFREPTDDEMPELVTGEGDRVVYRLADDSVTLFGDDAPAAVRRAGGGGTTTGRALIYRLGAGTLEVDTGAQGGGHIRTSGR
jgi:lipopolysaccharide export system protein LptA